MNQNPVGPPGDGPGLTGMRPARQGSVRRARERLETGMRQGAPAPDYNYGEPRAPAPNMRPTPPYNNNNNNNPALSTASVHSHGSPLLPKQPIPVRYARPIEPTSPSVYSVASTQPSSSFSRIPVLPPPHRLAPQQWPKPVADRHNSNPPITAEVPIHLSARKQPKYSMPANRQDTARGRLPRNNNLAPPPSERRPPSFDVPLIVDEPSPGPKLAVPSGHVSARASDIIGAYMDSESDDDRASKIPSHDDQAGLVRHASLASMAKPSLRVIHGKSSTDSFKSALSKSTLPGAAAKEVSVDSGDGDSTARPSSDAYKFDSEKFPFPLNTHDRQPGARDIDNDFGSLEKEIGVLLRVAPKMSDKRPFGRRPPPLNMDAVREAQARGSLTSLHDLIKRATRLASNLEHGRTASKVKLANNGPHNDSSSISDILASFPPPGLSTPERRGSAWPQFFQKSSLNNVESLHSEPGAHGASKRRRRCFGMAPWLFVTVCVVLIIVILTSILVPVFLVAVSQEKESNITQCEKSMPCQNGGKSVSNGASCACVCSNGYTGIQCTIPGDASCITTTIPQGSKSNAVTIGNALPSLFEGSQTNFGIPLDHVTILALFSQANVSCATENALVSFTGIDSSSSSHKNKRDLPYPIAVLDEQSHAVEPQQTPERSSSTFPEFPTRTIAARESVVTSNGIVFDSSPQESGSMAVATPAHTPTTPATPAFSPSPARIAVSKRVLDFSRTSVLFILQKTGELSAAMDLEAKIQSFLASGGAASPNSSSSSSSNSGSRNNLVVSGYSLRGNFVLDYGKFSIMLPNGTVVGGKL